MTTWINSQFPRPDFHRRVQRHYGLQDTGIPPSELLARLKTSVNGKTKQPRAKRASKRTITSDENLLEFMDT